MEHYFLSNFQWDMSMLNTTGDIANNVYNNVENAFFMACFAMKMCCLFAEEMYTKTMESEYVDVIMSSVVPISHSISTVVNTSCSLSYNASVNVLLTLMLTAIHCTPNSVKKTMFQAVHSTINTCQRKTYARMIYSKKMDDFIDHTTNENVDEWIDVDIDSDVLNDNDPIVDDWVNDEFDVEQ